MMGKTDWLAKAMHHYDQSRGATSYEATDFNMKAAHLCIALYNAGKEQERLHEAATAIYEAGHWSCDRPVDEVRLWETLRDALGRRRGLAPKPMVETVSAQPQPFDCEEVVRLVFDAAKVPFEEPEDQRIVGELRAYVRSLGYEVKE